MTLLEIDLGQTHAFHNNGVSGNQIIKTVGIIDGIDYIGTIANPIFLMNKPMGNIFFIRKEGNTKEYTLVLTFEKVI